MSIQFRQNLRISHQRFFILITALVMVLTPKLHAGFEIGDFGTRSLGLGRAYTALAGDGEALSYNIAGLARTPTNLVFTSYSNLFGGINEGSLRHFSAGVVYDDAPFLGRLGAGLSVFTSGVSQEIQIPVATTFQLPWNISAGVALRGLYWGMTPDVDPVTGVQDNALSKFTFTADAGLFYDLDLGTLSLPLGLTLPGKFAEGFAVKNLIPTSIAVDGDQKDAGRLPILPRAGVAWITNSGLVSMDYVLDDGGQLRTGVELNTLSVDNNFGKTAILVRAGGASAGDHGGSELSGGFGLRYNQFRLDAAYVWSQSLLDAGATQRYTLTYEF